MQYLYQNGFRWIFVCTGQRSDLKPVVSGWASKQERTNMERHPWNSLRLYHICIVALGLTLYANPAYPQSYDLVFEGSIDYDYDYPFEVFSE